MILFLDFDGVLHELDRLMGIFSREEHLAHVLRDYPQIEIVVSSAWRQDYTLQNIRTFFLTDLRNRIVGITPTLEIHDAGDIAGSRYREILTYLDGNAADWLALDDDAILFPPDCAELVLCDDGFKYAEELALRTALGRFAYLGKMEPSK